MPIFAVGSRVGPHRNFRGEGGRGGCEPIEAQTPFEACPHPLRLELHFIVPCLTHVLDWGQDSTHKKWHLRAKLLEGDLAKTTLKQG